MLEKLLMARCDEGYLCEVCGDEVAEMTDSDLYLRYILGEVEMEQLPNSPERHIRCNPAIAQYIIDDDFEPVTCEGMFAKSSFDEDYVREEEQRITRAWRRLQQLPNSGLSLAEYPLR